MVSYQAPVQDMMFVMRDLGYFTEHLAKLPTFADLDCETIESILEEAGKFCQQRLLPINQSGDQEGCRLEAGDVRTPSGFRQAYQDYYQAGWPSLAGEPQSGGQGLPHSVNLFIDEMLCSSNLSFQLYPNLTQGVSRCLAVHADESLRSQYLEPLVTGRWTGAMCLTEAHCGTDLSLIKTQATPQEDGSFSIRGSKTFITAGDHDLAENIIHIVLARTPDAPAGVKGLSLFLVPKFLLTEQRQLSERNQMSCSSLEHKLGIRASATCVMQYDDARGFLVGKLNQGLAAMFTVMNIERLAIGIQGLGLAEVAYQNALDYAKQRLQGAAPHSKQYQQEVPCPLIAHPDIRRLLWTMKAFTEGARAWASWVYQAVDMAEHSTGEQQSKAQALIDLMTPVLKAYISDQGFIQCNHALQVLGGHGYIVESGFEQWVRDARIPSIYEGANGIQALDLVKRKLVADKARTINDFMNQVKASLSHDHQVLADMSTQVSDALKDLNEINTFVCEHAQTDPDLMGSVSMDYLHYVALISLAYQWIQIIKISITKQGDFYQDKLKTAMFFFDKIFPEVKVLKHKIMAGSQSLMTDCGAFET